MVGGGQETRSFPSVLPRLGLSISLVICFNNNPDSAEVIDRDFESHIDRFFSPDRWKRLFSPLTHPQGQMKAASRKKVTTDVFHSVRSSIDSFTEDIVLAFGLQLGFNALETIAATSLEGTFFSASLISQLVRDETAEAGLSQGGLTQSHQLRQPKCTASNHASPQTHGHRHQPAVRSPRNSPCLGVLLGCWRNVSSPRSVLSRPSQRRVLSVRLNCTGQTSTPERHKTSVLLLPKYESVIAPAESFMAEKCQVIEIQNCTHFFPPQLVRGEKQNVSLSYHRMSVRALGSRVPAVDVPLRRVLLLPGLPLAHLKQFPPSFSRRFSEVKQQLYLNRRRQRVKDRGEAEEFPSFALPPLSLAPRLLSRLDRRLLGRGGLQGIRGCNDNKLR